MKQFTWFILAIFLAGNAFAGLRPNMMVKPEFGFKLRADYLINDSDDGNKNTGGTAHNANDELEDKRFGVGWARFEAFGPISENMFYLFNLRLIPQYGTGMGHVKPNSGAVVDASSNKMLRIADGTVRVDDALFGYKFADNWTLHIGQMYIFPLGWEGKHTPEAHYYTTLATSNSYIGYHNRFKAGLRFHYRAHMQSVMISILNANEEKNQQSPMFGLRWEGKFLEGKLETIASFFHLPMEEQSGSFVGNTATHSKTDQYWSLGIKGNFMEKRLAVSLNMHMNNHKDAAAKGSDNNETTYFLDLSYMHEDKFKPFLKYEISNTEVAEADAIERNAFELGFEWYPTNKPKIFNMHLVYWQTNDEYESAQTSSSGVVYAAGADVTTSQWMLGATLSI